MAGQAVANGARVAQVVNEMSLAEQGLVVGGGTAGAVLVLEEAAPTAGKVTTEVAELAFSQTTASPRFSADGTFAGKTIGGLAEDLRLGNVTASDVPVGYVTIGENNLIVNTRSSLALMRAGIPQSEWKLINVTETFGADIQQRLLRNGLGSEGTPVLRITGVGSGASSLE